MKDSITPLFDTIDYLDEPNPYITALLNEVEENVSDCRLVYELAVDFLKEYTGSPSTFKSYRAEIEKFLYWCWVHTFYSVSEIDKVKLREYLSFIQHPDANLVGSPSNSRFKLNKQTDIRTPNESWRPFVKTGDVYTFSKRSLHVSLSALSKFFEHLNDEEYCERNPAAILKRKNEFKINKQIDDEDIHYFTQEQWKLLLSHAEKDDSLEGIRNRFLLIFMYSMYPRISEVSVRPSHIPLMADLALLPQHKAYVFKIKQSKGFKDRNVTVSDAVKEEFRLYRAALNLAPFPAKNEMTPLFPIIRSGKITYKGIGIRRMRDVITGIFAQVSDECFENGDAVNGEIFSKATPHWLRHTGISHDININHRSLSNVRDDAGHDSIETTSKYIHSSIKERYASAKDKVF